nr:nucleoporin ndc1 [Quercus suber]
MTANLQPAQAVQSPASPPLSRPYKDFLTPALHRRFTHAAAVVLACCWLEGVLMSHNGWFWTIFPLGPAAIRTLLLFIPCLAVFIVRLANMHIGRLTTTSPFETFVLKTTEWGTLVTLGWYIFSAWFFGEVYVWTRTAEANLAWVDRGNAYERPRVNENPMWLRCLYILLAFTQSGLHLAFDYDRVPIEQRDSSSVPAERPDESRVPIPKFVHQISHELPRIARNLGNTVIPTIIFSFPIYFGFGIRALTWPWASGFARTFNKELPAGASPTGLINAPLLLWQAFSSSVLLVLLWNFSNVAFTIFLAEPPLKKGQPLTNEINDAQGNTLSKSKDPNGSLIRGLRAKKDVPKSFAFWELKVISHGFPDRRKTIFAEVERKDGNTWTQIATNCLQEIEAISHRIVAAQTPRQASQPATSEPQQPDYNMPKIGDQKIVSDRDVLRHRNPSDLVHTVANIAKSVGQSPGAVDPVSPRARKALTYGIDHAVSRETQQRWQKDGVSQEVGSWMMVILRQPSIGWIFQQTFSRCVAAAVLGVPYSKKSDIEHAVESLVKLSTVALTEDNYGQVSKDVPRIVRTLTKSITDLSSFVATFAPSWTDVDFGPKRTTGHAGESIELPARHAPEAQEVLVVLKSGLEQTLLAYGEYASGLGLSKKEVREAREAVGQGAREMSQR